MQTKRLLFLIFAGIFLIALLFIPKVKNIFYDVLYPFLYTFSVVSEEISEISMFLKDKNELIEENQNLKKNIELLKAEIVSLKYLELENAKLKELLNFSNILDGYTFITSKIVGYSPDNWSNIVLINGGKKNGIKKGDLVISNGKLFGIVSSVGYLT